MSKSIEHVELGNIVIDLLTDNYITSIQYVDENELEDFARSFNSLKSNILKGIIIFRIKKPVCMNGKSYSLNVKVSKQDDTFVFEFVRRVKARYNFAELLPKDHEIQDNNNLKSILIELYENNIEILRRDALAELKEFATQGAETAKDIIAAKMVELDQQMFMLNCTLYEIEKL